MRIEEGSITIADSAFVDNTGNGITIFSGAGLSRTDIDGGDGPSFQRNVCSGNLSRPLSLPAGTADEIDVSSVLTGNLTDEIELLSGTLRFTGTWEDHGLPYVVKASALVDVRDGPQARLTIADGVRLVFGRSAGLRVGSGEAGRLIVDGHTEGVIMTATDDVISDSTAWDGITISSEDLGSELRGLTIEHGGNNGQGNIYVSNASPVLEGVISRFSDGHGLSVTGSASAPAIRDSVFSDNDENGVYLASSSRMSEGTSFSGNTMTGNGLAPLVLPAEELGSLDATSSFAGNGLPIRVHSGDVETDAVWSQLDEVYTFTGNVTIEGPQDPVVTVEDGVAMTFASNTRLSVGINDDGSLIVDGHTLGVTMQSDAELPGEGDWHGLKVGSRNAGTPSQLHGLTIAHAGGADTGTGGALELVDSDGCGTQADLVAMSDLVIESSSKAALFVGSWVTFSLDGATFTDNLGGCVYVAGSSTCAAPEVSSFTGVTCLGSPEFGTWPLSQADQLDETSTYPGPIVIPTTRLRSDLRLRNFGVPYHFLDSVIVGETTGAVLTVEAGNTLAFGIGEGLGIGTTDPGGIVFEPGPTTVLTSLATSPMAGDWNGVRIGDDCTVADVVDVDIRYAGDNGVGALWIDGCGVNGPIDRVTVESSNTCGLYYDSAESTMALGSISYVANNLDVCP